MTSGTFQEDQYFIFDSDSLRGYLARVDRIRYQLGGAPETWDINEVGDGNLNLVFLVLGRNGGVAAKQALPYVRVVGEGWPLPISRAHYEKNALEVQGRYAPGLVPSLLHSNHDLALNVMDLKSPHIVMRYGMLEGIRYPNAPEALARFSADTLFHTSDLALSAEHKRRLIGEFSGNGAMCKLVEDLVFVEPFTMAKNNRWTEGLDNDAAAIRSNTELKLAASRLKMMYQSSAEALLHGDLHTGSIMVTETDTTIIDAEFAVMGPMGYDLGVLLANFLMNYFAQTGHGTAPQERHSYADWVLNAAETYWNSFCNRFEANWRQHGSAGVYAQALFADDEAKRALEQERKQYMKRLFIDSLGFAGVEIIRRILGMAHNADFETIADIPTRAQCERRALNLASKLLAQPSQFRTIEDVTHACVVMNQNT